MTSDFCNAANVIIGYHHLETPTWEVKIAPIRHKLKRIPIQHSVQQRQRRINPRRNVKSRYATRVPSAPGSSSTLPNGIGSQSSSDEDSLLDAVQQAGLYYYRMNYKVVAVFKGGMMNYSLKIEKVDESYEGYVNMAPYLTEHVPENE
jgi:hypothetical protein